MKCMSMLDILKNIELLMFGLYKENRKLLYIGFLHS